MIVSSVNAVQISGLVWQTTVRTLSTVFGPLAVSYAPQTTLAAGQIVIIVGSPGWIYHITSCVTGQAGGLSQTGYFDGINLQLGHSITSANPFEDAMFSTTQLPFVINNASGTLTLTYAYVVLVYR